MYAFVGTAWERFVVSGKHGRARGFASSEAHRTLVKRKYQKTKVIRSPHAPEHRPPAEVLAERDQAMWRPITLTALLLGDPWPGRSALDKRENA